MVNGWWQMADGCVMTTIDAHDTNDEFFFFLFFSRNRYIPIYCTVTGIVIYPSVIDTQTRIQDCAKRKMRKEKSNIAESKHRKFNQIFLINFNVWRELVNLNAFVIRYFMFFSLFTIGVCFAAMQWKQNYY